MNLKELIKSISAKTGATVNIEMLDKTFGIIDSLWLGNRDHYHHGSYCEFAKLNGNQALCGKNKRRTKRLARHGERFCGYCPFGMWDLVEPVMFQGELVAIIYIGSFQGTRPLKKINAKQYQGPALPQLTPEKKQQVAYYATFLSEFIKLAYQHWIDSGNTLKKKENPDSYRNLIIRYIENHYHQPCQLSELAESLSMNPNYLGELIHKIFSKSFSQLLTVFRINQAKVLLRSYKTYPISNIAYECGFNDSNYFSTVFKKITGLTPRQYRNGMEPPQGGSKS